MYACEAIQESTQLRKKLKFEQIQQKEFSD